MTNTRGRDLSTNQWQDWGNLVLAIWLFISPWVLRFAPGTSSEHIMAAAAWDAWIVGIIIGALSIAALARAQPWEEWVNLVAGAWLFISPWVLKFSGDKTTLWNALIVGALVVILSIWDLNTQQTAAGRRA
jgi:hypothetical protein